METIGYNNRNLMVGLLCILLLILSSIILAQREERKKQEKEIEQIEGVKVETDTLRKNILLEQVKYEFVPDSTFLKKSLEQTKKLDSIILKKKKK